MMKYGWYCLELIPVMIRRYTAAGLGLERPALTAQISLNCPQCSHAAREHHPGFPSLCLIAPRRKTKSGISLVIIKKNLSEFFSSHHDIRDTRKI